ncbi:LysR family transcriptional regulator [Photobacterium sp. WH77]|uniref:LysR family transcriptional regulator n=1 Tax=unclassified Photobacterium TaxID=2628852 RepID=UPI001C47B16F|nr:MULTISPECIES: LysR family transcriptional regulator [unclassified Photobacterium]MBV7263667.1 LysR family transcriptional regulator [Photobacterium sp. WH24]MCG2836457.1 LysR family transcriptional regulator [Photobacterium sp. WH77]MCG2843916.1 LysR family transcriptional regulator [Photobacterium sp. WH80]
MDRLTAAKVFIDVATTESFTTTADRLEMSRSMVTRYIATMEEWMKARLLQRTTRKVALTTAGQQCLKEIKLWVEQAEHIAVTLQPADRLTGHVRLTTSMSFAHAQLAKAIQPFLALNPEVSVEIDVRDQVTDLIAERFDLAIRIAMAPDPSLIGKPIAGCDSVIVASPSYLKRSSDIQVPADLSHHQCLGNRSFEQHVWHLTKNNVTESVEVTCRFISNEATVLKAAAIEGAGIAVQPTYLVSEDIQAGRLAVVLADWVPKSMSVYALYPAREYLLPAVRGLIDHLAQYFEDNHWPAKPNEFGM